jgi:hypothetical protein
MKKIEPYPVASALFFIAVIFYIVCISVKLILMNLGIEGFWHMHKFWEFILPGFSSLSLMDFILGVLEVGLGAYAIGYLVVLTYNYLNRKSMKNNQTSPKPFFLRFKVLFLTILTYSVLLFTLCFVYDLVIPENLSMSFIWSWLLPGFEKLSFSNYLIGIADLLIYSLYSASIFTWVLNYFEKVQFVNVK